MSSSPQKSSIWILSLAALGIVYGDIGTSPLYALRECFHGPHSIPLTEQNLFGVLSLIFWALILVVSLKYLQFIMRADNNGEGGGLALTALACLQKSKKIKYGNGIALALGLFSSALLVGDGMITPAISVLSAVEGLQIATPIFNDYILPITIIILIGLSFVQKYGTGKIGVAFGPIMLIWFSTLGILGVNSIMSSPNVLRATNPFYAINFFYNNFGYAFIALSSVFLVVTGGEALYADMGHFGRKAISRSWYYVALPGLVLNYFGQGALLLRDNSLIDNPFYYLVPRAGLYPLVILATISTIIASQAIISGLFSLARQAIQLGYAPRLEIVHTSSKEIGQIYVPPVNWLCLIGTLWLVIEFKSSSNLAAAYGIAVSLTMVITSLLAGIVASLHWNWSHWKIAGVLIVLLTIDSFFLAANFLKIADGGWVPLVIAGLTYLMMITWRKGRRVLRLRLREHAVPIDKFLKLIELTKPLRVAGSAVYMSGDPKTVPPALIFNLKHNKVLHENVVFLTVSTTEIPFVHQAQRIKIEKLAPGIFRVVGYYGFSETPDIMLLFEKAKKMEPELKLEDPSFILGREVILSTDGLELFYWQKKLFSFLSKNARSATSYFHLPPDRVIEVGKQIEM
jgi:KUP system potassium uptake protein